MAIMRKTKINKFTTVDNFFIDDKRLDPEGKGYLLYMLRKPDNWNFSFKNIEFDLNVGERNVRTNMKKLESLHYLKRVRSRDENGHYEWNYFIYETPFDMELKIDNLPYVHNEHVDGESVHTDHILLNTNELNINELKDGIDNSDISHEKYSSLTWELINLEYISKGSSDSYCFDEFFKSCLSEGISYRELYKAIHYIAPRVKARNFKDESGKDIGSKYFYFKTSFESNYSRFKNPQPELYSDEYCENFFKEYDIERR